MNLGKPGILYEGFRLRKDRDFKTTHLWRCVKKKLAYTMILGGRFDHDHVEERDSSNSFTARSVNRGKSSNTLFIVPGYNKILVAGQERAVKICAKL